jgi:hypothetical protein
MAFTTRCDIATAFMTSSPPLLPLNETAGGPDEQFSSPLLRDFLSSDLRAQSLPGMLDENSLSEILSQDLIRVYKDMSTLTAILNLKARLVRSGYVSIRPQKSKYSTSSGIHAYVDL